MKWTRSHVVALSAAVGGAAGCGSIWGFEDPIEVASTDGGAESGLDPSPTPGIVCVPPAPEGWQGPLAIEEEGDPAALRDCTAKFAHAFDAVANPKIDGTGCTCSCEPDGTYDCGAPLVSFFSDNMCKTSCATSQAAQTQQAKECDSFDTGTCGGAADYFAKATAPKPVGKPCKAIQTPPPPYKLTSAARLCTADLGSAAGTTCPAGKIAAPGPVLPYETGNLCVVSSTAQKCPEGYPTPHTYFDPGKVTDARKCNDCTCGEPTGGPCTGQLITADNATDCGSNTVKYTLPVTDCSLVKKTNKVMIYKEDGPPASVACTAGGGGVAGEVALGAPLTICCRL